MKKTYIFILALAFLLYLWLLAPVSALKVGDMAPEFSIPDLNGNMVFLADFKEKTVFLNFWSVDCPLCVKEKPSIQSLKDKVDSDNFEMISINIDDDPIEVQKFLDKYGYNFLTLHDKGAKVSTLYRVNKYPETFILDGSGQIIAKFTGAYDWSTRDKIDYLNNLLNLTN